jgi:DNA-binding CsgD family transcriptional regulator
VVTFRQMSLWSRLTPRQAEVCELLIQGYKHGQIAELLNISLRTVKAHFERIFNALELRNKNYLRYIQAAALLTYDRYPELVPRNDLGAVLTSGQRPNGRFIHRERIILYTQPQAYPTRQDQPAPSAPDHDSQPCDRISTAYGSIC